MTEEAMQAMCKSTKSQGHDSQWRGDGGQRRPQRIYGERSDGRQAKERQSAVSSCCGAAGAGLPVSLRRTGGEACTCLWWSRLVHCCGLGSCACVAHALLGGMHGWMVVEGGQHLNASVSCEAYRTVCDCDKMMPAGRWPSASPHGGSTSASGRRWSPCRAQHATVPLVLVFGGFGCIGNNW